MKTSNDIVIEKWSEKYKRSIDCSNPQGFSQRAHCQGRKKNEMAMSDLSSVEKYADKQLDPADVEFTKHFFDRVTDPRNIKPISVAELIGFFKRIAQRKKSFIEFLKKYNQFVVTDKRTDINIPFVRQVNHIIAKTIMRKKGFMSSNPRFTVESLFTTDNKIKPYEKLLVSAVIDFMKSKLGFNANIIVKKKSSKELFGDVVLNDNSVNNNKFYVHFNPNQSYDNVIKSLIHELTHVKQISKGELRPSNDYKEVLWKGKPVISAKEYSNFRRQDIAKYKSLPWEKEAYSNMKPLYNQFLSSKQWSNLVGQDPTLDYILSNL